MFAVLLVVFARRVRVEGRPTVIASFVVALVVIAGVLLLVLFQAPAP